MYVLIWQIKVIVNHFFYFNFFIHSRNLLKHLLMFQLPFSFSLFFPLFKSSFFQISTKAQWSALNGPSRSSLASILSTNELCHRWHRVSPESKDLVWLSGAPLVTVASSLMTSTQESGYLPSTNLKP